LKNFLIAGSRGYKAQSAFQGAANYQRVMGSSFMQSRFFGTVQPVPSMGDSISEGVIETYVKQPGEFVQADEVVARIETDKVTVDILSTHAGVISKFFNEEGDTVEVGADFLEIDTDAK
jgi:2-oxoglutarate dehydrogenase E2 component (dihydrolipoamide succinyltransferase)